MSGTYIEIPPSGGGGGTPGGSSGDVQFNDSGVLGGSSNLTWNGSSLAVTGSVDVTGDIGATGNVGGATGGFGSVDATTYTVAGTSRITSASGLMDIAGAGGSPELTLGATGFGPAVIVNTGSLFEVASGQLMLAIMPSDASIPTGYVRFSYNGTHFQLNNSSGPTIPFFTPSSPGTGTLITFTDIDDNLGTDPTLSYSGGVLYTSNLTASSTVTATTVSATTLAGDGGALTPGSLTGSYWGGAGVPATINEAIERIAAVVSIGGGSPIP